MIRAACLLGLFVALPTAAVPDDKPIDFDRDVKPIFAKHCASCHGADKQRGGFRLDRKTDALTGGDTGVAISPGKAAVSALIHRVSGKEKDSVMPPKGERLSPAEVATLTAWINQGAKWPDDGSTVNPADWWSFKPLKRPVVPEIQNPKSKSKIRSTPSCSRN